MKSSHSSVLSSMEAFMTSSDGSRPISSIQKVWDHLTLNLREIRDKLRKINDIFYAKQDRLSYIQSVHASLKQVHDLQASRGERSLLTVASLGHLEQLLGGELKTTRSPRQLQASIDTLKTFLSNCQVVLAQALEVKIVFTEDVLEYLEYYCNNYTALGIADDQFYKNLRSRTVSVRGYLKKFERLAVAFKLGTALPGSAFSDHYFSQEVSIECNCDTFPILRIIPDLIQKLERSCDTASDWLRSDKVYYQELEKEIEKTRQTVRVGEEQVALCALEYGRLFSLLRQRQQEGGEEAASQEDVWRDVARLEAKKARLEMEVSAVARTLAGCRDHLAELADCAVPAGSDTDSDEEQDVKQKCGGRRMGNASSNYKTRLCNDAKVHSAKLDMLRKKKKKLEKLIQKKRQMAKDMETSEIEVMQLSKKLRVCGRQKAKHVEELDAANAHLTVLTTVLKNRTHPQPPGQQGEEKKDLRKSEEEEKRRKSRSDDSKGKSKVKASEKSRRREDVEDKTDQPARSKKSADLLKAFRLIKNNIGLGWKDLARSLPYLPGKDVSELNNEIRVIEYENQGQLKEQAYQSLIKWFSHNGRRASVEVLRETLRELNENRLADSIEKHVMGHTSRPSSDTSTSSRGA